MQLSARISEQQSQIDRQEQIINALKDQLQKQQAQAGRGDGMRPGSGRKPPQDLIQLQSENTKLRELVQLLQEKLDEQAQDEY